MNNSPQQLTICYVTNRKSMHVFRHIYILYLRVIEKAGAREQGSSGSLPIDLSVQINFFFFLFLYSRVGLLLAVIVQ